MGRNRAKERGVGLLEANEKKLRKELAEARSRLDDDPQSLLYIEPVGRCLRWLDDPESEELFAQAAARYEEGVRLAGEQGRDVTPRMLLGLGTCYRLAGHQGRARGWYERAFTRLGPPEEVPWGTSNYTDKIVLAFLLGRDEEAVQLQGAEAWARDNPWLDAMADVSEARVSEDASLAGEAAEAVAGYIRESRIKISDGPFDLHPWDQYEITLRAKAELEGRADDAALPAPDLLRREHELAVGGADNQETRTARRKLTSEQVEDICFEEDEEPDLHSTDLSGLDLSDLDLSGAILADCDLRGADLSNTMLVETNFTGADMRGVKMVGTVTQDTVFEGADLSGTDLSGARLAGSDFSKANLRGANLRDANLPHADFTEADLSAADLRGANLEEADLEEAIMQGTIT
jgi:uncharacterized protein YjbI with pentapeptide repeats